ncbi:MAG: hypothetical protein JXB88_22870 [Spirochaetales bacterium]|nr:hypothetical protein [Spirochaetales bacterium]
MSSRYILCIISMVLLVAYCEGQQNVISYEGAIVEGERKSEPLPFKVDESAFFTITVRAGFDTVLEFHPLTSRGFVWDGSEEGILKNTGFFQGSETYNICIRAVDGEQIDNPGFTIIIEQPEVKQISPGEIVTGNFNAEAYEYGWYYEVLYIMKIDKKGVYRITLKADNKVKCFVTGKKMTMLLVTESKNTDTGEIEITEPGICGISIRYFEKKEGSYSIVIES